MTLTEAFDLFLDNEGKTNYAKGTWASWKRRFKRGELGFERMKDLLTVAGYKKLEAPEEQWATPDGDFKFEVFYTIDQKFHVNTVSAKDKEEARYKVYEKNKKAKNITCFGDLNAKTLIKWLNRTDWEV